MEFYVIPVTMNTNANRLHIFQRVIPLIYFTLDTLLTTATIYQNQWYTLIKLAREQSHSDILDEFSASSSLCTWVGLPLHNTGIL